MTHIIDSINVENNLTYNTNSPGVTSKATTLNGSDVLDVNSSFIRIYTGTATGYSVVLPDATTLTDGWKYDIFNESLAPILVKDKVGTVLATVAQTSVGRGILESKATVAGDWIFYQVFITGDSIVHYTATSSTLFSTTSQTYTTIPSFTVTPTAGKYAVWYNASAFTNKNNLLYYCQLAKAGVGVTDTQRTFLGISSSYRTTQVTMGIIDFNGTEACTVLVQVGPSSGNTMEITNRSLILIRLGGV